MTARQLYVFAGPNGAGKSYLSASMVPNGTPIFDGDKEFERLRLLYYDLDKSQIWESITETHFPDWKIKMIAGKSDAAFETNFRDPEVITSVRQFMNGGFKSHLVFMGLDSFEASKKRVELRVLKGGHNVSTEYIRINFEQSLINLSRFYQIFDSINLYQNFHAIGEDENTVSLMTVIEGKIIEEALQLPDWAKQFKAILNSEMK